MNINFQNMVAIFLVFLFVSVLFSILLKKINKIENNERIVYKDRPNHFFYNDIPNYIPNYIFYDDTPYMFPRRSIDINVINKSDTSNDEKIARELQSEYDKIDKRYTRPRRSGRSPSPSILKTPGKSSSDTRRRRRVTIVDGKIQKLEPFDNSNTQFCPFN